MSLTNTTHSYGALAKLFHWTTAVLILALFPLGMIANGMAEGLRDPAASVTEAQIAQTVALFSAHKTLGLAVFFIALLRVGWSLTQPRPGLLNAENRVEATLAETIHWLLYGSILLVPLSGWLHHAATTGFAPIRWPFGQSLPLVPKSEGFAELMAGLHLVLQRVLLAAVVLHIAGALKHHVVDRDATLRRMLPHGGTAPQPPKQHKSLVPPLAALTIWGAAIVVGAGSGLFGHTSAPAAAQAQQDIAPASGGAGWTVTDGSLGITVTQLGSPVSGQFADWTAAITFEDPAQPGPAGQVDVIVNIASLTLGSVTDQAMGPDYFDASAFPTAIFSADLEKTAQGYLADGTLTIRDQTVPVQMPFQLILDGENAEMTGQLELNRMEFGVGASVTDAATLGFGVDVVVTLTASRS
ncbi:cytochrome b/b6 domain-containing protein [Seohaeicola saemankumensis]|nr:cytochrome b/b6 domain-containing protein [Seohaeicola saemankumensis]MCA0873673.1 cytochrome b/b6 domain-containing protein [Seohaeicola saemankumensis]